MLATPATHLPLGMNDVVELSDDEDDIQTPGKLPIIDLSGSDDEGPIEIIEDLLKVDQLCHLDDAPEYWAVCRPGTPTTAYSLDFRGSVYFDRLTTPNGNELSMDGYIKKQVFILRAVFIYFKLTLTRTINSVRIHGPEAQVLKHE